MTQFLVEEALAITHSVREAAAGEERVEQTAKQHAIERSLERRDRMLERLGRKAA